MFHLLLGGMNFQGEVAKKTKFLSSKDWLEIVFYLDFKRIWIMYFFERIKSRLDLIWIIKLSHFDPNFILLIFFQT